MPKYCGIITACRAINNIGFCVYVKLKFKNKMAYKIYYTLFEFNLFRINEVYHLTAFKITNFLLLAIISQRPNSFFSFMW